MAEQIKLRRRYTTGGVVKKVAAKGNGDSGNHKRKKLSAQEKAKLVPQTPRMMYVNKLGHRRMIDAP